MRISTSVASPLPCLHLCVVSGHAIGGGLHHLRRLAALVADMDLRRAQPAGVHGLGELKLEDIDLVGVSRLQVRLQVRALGKESRLAGENPDFVAEAGRPDAVGAIFVFPILVQTRQQADLV